MKRIAMILAVAGTLLLLDERLRAPIRVGSRSVGKMMYLHMNGTGEVDGLPTLVL